MFVDLNLKQTPQDQQAILFQLGRASREGSLFPLSGRGGLSMWEVGKKSLLDLCGRRKLLVLALPQHSAHTLTGPLKHQFIGACV